MIADGQRTAGCRRLPLHSSTQMDQILPFLGSVAAESFLDVQTDEKDQSILVAHRNYLGLHSQQEVQRQLVQIVQRTICSPCLHGRITKLREDATSTIYAMSHPLECGLILRTLSSIGEAVARAATLGNFYTPHDIPPRTPTEIVAVLLDLLDSAKASTNRPQQTKVMQCIEDAEKGRLRCAISAEEVESMLEVIQSTLASVGLRQVGSTIGSLLDELRSHGPAGPPPTRLHDNMYGRVWETALNAKLMEEMPPAVIEAARTMRMALLAMVQQVPEELGQAIRKSFMNRIGRELPRPWSDNDGRLQELNRVENPSRIAFEEFLRMPTESGYDVAGNYFVGKVLFDVFKEVAPDLFTWRAEAGVRYRHDIVPLKGNLRFERVSTENKAGSGITLAHHPHASPGRPSERVVLHSVWDLDAITASSGTGDTLNMIAMKQGIPVCTGISGYTHLFTSFFLEIKKTLKLDVRHAILGLLVYLVVEGGHTWNEGLMTLNYMERKLAMGILPVTSDVATFVADYSCFISIFDGCDTKEYIDRAIAFANEATILYRREHVSR